ncbi:MAG TPA: hypothetical protein VFQ05_08050 [Candidatus Eisenbacteria bacterium]|nr:hypothetical protein [Candidatus Eisenbacteria bacterium]
MADEPQRPPRSAVVLPSFLWPAAAVLLYVIFWWPVRMFVADDTFIHLTYAKHVRDGHGLVFNLGERVFGTTSPLWSLALGWLGWTRIDLLLLARILSAVLGALVVLLGARALCLLLDDWAERGWLEPRFGYRAWAIGTLAWGADVWLARWSASGMESSLGALLVLAGFVSYQRSRPWGSAPGRPGAWWAVASLIRPEAALLVLLLALRAGIEPGSPLVRARRVGAALLPAALLGGAWLAYAAAFYGTVIPVTLASKASEGTPFIHNLVIQAQELAADRGIELIAILLGLPLLLRRLAPSWREHLVPLGWLIGLPLFYGVTHVLGITRYLMLITPLVAAYGWGAMALLASSMARRPAPALASLALVLAGLASVGVNAFVLARHVMPQARHFDRIIQETLIPTARWFRDFTPPQTMVAIAHVGVFGYYSERRILDLSGLVTTELTPVLATYQYDRVITDLLFPERVRPDYLIDVDNESRRLKTRSPYTDCLDLIDEKPYDYRSIRTPERGYLTVYRVDWGCVDATPRR